MRAARAYQNVGQHTAVMSGDPIDLVILLYDKLLQRLREVKASIDRGGYESGRRHCLTIACPVRALDEHDSAMQLVSRFGLASNHRGRG
ncbi:MAG: hypothetical protein EBU75_01550 [Betaproteobacteria bacterium]|nr:hypothetical protein [Betaproteobacteria bacterium]